MKFRIHWREPPKWRRRKPRFVLFSIVCDQKLAPDTLPEQTNLTGAVTDIDEPVNTPDANWLVFTPP